MKYFITFFFVAFCFLNDMAVAGCMPSRRVARSPDQMEVDIPNKPQYSGELDGSDQANQSNSEAHNLQGQGDNIHSHHEQGQNEGSNQYTKGQDGLKNETSYQESQNNEHNSQANEAHENQKENIAKQEHTNSEHYNENNDQYDLENYETKGKEEKENAEKENSEKLENPGNNGSDSIDKGQDTAENHDFSGDTPSYSYHSD